MHNLFKRTFICLDCGTRYGSDKKKDNRRCPRCSGKLGRNKHLNNQKSLEEDESN